MRDARPLSLTQISRRSLGIFDTVLTLGNNFCLVGAPRRARWLLRRLYGMTSSGGTIVAQTRDPYATDVPEHLAYHDRNRAAGRMGGHARLRVRYRRYVTPWIEFLMVSPQELRELLVGTGWVLQTILPPGSLYAAILAKADSEEK